MLVGGGLIGRWVVGLELILGGLLAAVDGLLRDTGQARPGAVLAHEDVLERWRRAR